MGPVDVTQTLAKFAELPQVIGEAFQGARRYRGEEDYIRQLQELQAAQALQQAGGPYAQGPAGPRLPSIAGMEGTAPTTNTYAFLRKEEGFRSKPYWDVNAPRAGYGSDTTTIPETGQVLPVTPNIRVTKEMAEADLSRRTAAFQDGIRKIIPGFDAMPEGTKTALTSVAYNYGNVPPVVVRAALTGNDDSLRAAIRGLKANPDRRQREASLIGKGAAEGETTPLAFSVRPQGAPSPPPVPSQMSLPLAGGAPPPALGVGGGVPQPPGPPPPPQPPPTPPDRPQQPPAMQNGQPLFPEPQFASLPGMQMPPPTAGGPGAPPAPMAAPVAPVQPPPPQPPPQAIPAPQAGFQPPVPPPLSPPPRAAPQAAPPPVPMPAGGMVDLMAAAVRSGRPDLIRATQAMMQQADPSDRYQIINAGEGRILSVDKQTQQVTDITPPAAPGAGPELFTGNAVEAQALNHLIAAGRLTPQQAAEIAASKTITDPATGQIRVVTPEQIIAAARATPGGGVGTALTGEKPTKPDNVSPEVAARIGLANHFLANELPNLRTRLGEGALDTPLSRAQMIGGYGEPAKLSEAMNRGAEALLRNLTGAGMGIDEARRYAARYGFSYRDRREEMTRKVSDLEADLKASRDAQLAGRNITAKELTGTEEPKTAPPSSMPQVKSDEDYQKLSPGTLFRDENGDVYRETEMSWRDEAELVTTQPVWKKQAEKQDASAPPPGDERFLEDIGTLLGPDETARLRAEARTRGRAAGPGTTVGLGLQQGVLRNFADELAAYGAASGAPVGTPPILSAPVGIAREMLGNPQVTQRYEQELARQRGFYEGAAEANPVTAIGSEIVGGFVGPTGVGAPGAALGQRIARGAGTAALDAAIAGAGAGEDPASRARGAGVGAAVGSAVGGAFPVAGQVVGQVARPFRGIDQAEMEAAQKVGGAIEADLEKLEPAARVARVQEIVEARGRGREQPTVLGDIGGLATQGLARREANVSPQAWETLQKATQERFESQGERARAWWGPSLDRRMR